MTNLNPSEEIRINLVREFIGNAKDKIVLDIGTNSFSLSGGIKAKKILKLDIIEEAKPDLICDLNTEKIPLKRDSVNVVLAGEILEHLNNPSRVVRDFHRVLKPKGILIVSVPNVCSLVNRIKMLFGKLPSHCAIPLDSEYPQNPESHQNDFNIKTILDVLVKSDFRIEGLVSNGIVIHSKVFWKSCPASFGEILVIKGRKV